MLDTCSDLYFRLRMDSISSNSKEKDLELAATIGQSLLERNRDLQDRNEALEEQLNYANEQVTQLKHELHLKIDLLHVYSAEPSEGDSSASNTPGDVEVDLESVQNKMKLLELENSTLKAEASTLKHLTKDFEEKEHLLASDCLKQLNELNKQVSNLSEDLSHKTEECKKSQEEVSHLLRQLVQQQTSNKTLMIENEELLIQIEAAKDTQHELTQELLDLQERYSEVLAMLHESRQELKRFRQRPLDLSSAYDSNYDSLASELEASDGGSYGPPRRTATVTSASVPFATFAQATTRVTQSSGTHIVKVQDSLRRSRSDIALFREQSAQTTGEDLSEDAQVSCSKDSHPFYLQGDSSVPGPSGGDHLSLESHPVRSAMVPQTTGVPRVPSLIAADNHGQLKKAPSCESIYSFCEAPEVGVPGIPGSRDLQIAVRRLALRRQVEREYQIYRLSNWAKRPVPCGAVMCSPYSNTDGSNPSLLTSPRHHEDLSSSLGATPRTGAEEPPTPILTPRSYRSRIDIIKSIQGSSLLDRWRHLATPSITRSLEPCPGIRVRAQKLSPPNISVLDTSEPLSSPMTHIPCIGTSSSSNELKFCVAAVGSRRGQQPLRKPDFMSSLSPDWPRGTGPARPHGTAHRRRNPVVAEVVHSMPTQPTYTKTQDVNCEGVDTGSSAQPRGPIRGSVSSTGSSAIPDNRAAQQSTATFTIDIGLARYLGERSVDTVSASPWISPCRTSSMTPAEVGPSSIQNHPSANRNGTSVDDTTPSETSPDGETTGSPNIPTSILPGTTSPHVARTIALATSTPATTPTKSIGALLQPAFSPELSSVGYTIAAQCPDLPSPDVVGPHRSRSPVTALERREIIARVSTERSRGLVASHHRDRDFRGSTPQLNQSTDDSLDRTFSRREYSPLWNPCATRLSLESLPGAVASSSVPQGVQGNVGLQELADFSPPKANEPGASSLTSLLDASLSHPRPPTPGVLTRANLVGSAKGAIPRTRKVNATAACSKPVCPRSPHVLTKRFPSGTSGVSRSGKPSDASKSPVRRPLRLHPEVTEDDNSSHDSNDTF